MSTVMTALTIIALLIVAQGVGAKRGCSAFGHSCFGGHGKRSGDTSTMDNVSPDIIARRFSGQEETPPHPGYPQTSYASLGPSEDDIIPVRDGGLYDHEDSAAREVMKFKLRNIVKHWMDNYRRSQLSNDDGYIMETM